MNTFDSLTLKAWINENTEFLTGARIQKIQQPTRRDFVFSIRKSGETRKFYININPQLHHICFMSKENENRRMIEIPKKPPMFCMLLRKYLENSVIYKVNQPPYERILELYIETFNELSEKIYLCLAVELMGKHSNVVLYNDDTNVIIGCAHNIGAEKSSVREMAGTLPYTYPPKQNKTDILTYCGEINYETMHNDFYWISKAFANHLEGQPVEKIKSLVNLDGISPVISADYKDFSLFRNLIKNPLPQKSVNEMLDNYFTYYQEKDKFQTLKIHLETFTNQKIKKLKNSRSKIEEQIKREKNSDMYRLFGDLIMANLYNNKDFSSSIEVYDYENNKNITIELDNTKTLKENANKFYKLYTKGKTSLQKSAEMKEQISENLAYYEQVRYSIETAENIRDLLEVKQELMPEEYKKTDKPKAIEPEKIKISGYSVYIGKNNRQNDYIISKLAKDDDLWFHTKDCAGSHVLLKGEKPPDEVILQCAKLAKEHSSAPKSSKIGVIYTKRKYLRKPPKANLGYVTYKNEKEIVID